MPSWLSPTVLDDVGVVGLVVFCGFLLYLSIGRRWLVPGGQHREIVGMWSETKDELNAQISAKDATIEVLLSANRAQARALERFSATGELSEKLLASLAEIAESGKP